MSGWSTEAKVVTSSLSMAITLRTTPVGSRRCRYFFPDSLVRGHDRHRCRRPNGSTSASCSRDATSRTQDPLARQMVNFCYLIGDRESGEAVVVDPAYDVGGLLDLLAEDGMRLSGVLVSHAHPDHVGGDMMGYSIEGLSDLLEQRERPRARPARRGTMGDTCDRSRGVGARRALERRHRGGRRPRIELVHTPGHTPGSQCFSVAGRLVSGDTLFLEGCGRTDLPGGDPEQMYESITTRLARFGDETILYPGHFYAAEPSATLGDTRLHNYVFRPRSVEQWLTMFGS